MNCQRLFTINRRLRVARESAQAGQCTIARSWLRKAARDLKATIDSRSTGDTVCARALADGAREMLVAGRKELRRSCK